MLKHFFILCLIIFILSCQGKNAGDQKASHQAQDSVPAEQNQPTPSKRNQPTRKPDFKAAGLTEGEVRTFFDALQSAVRNDDKQAMAKMIDYPCNVSAGNQSFKVKSAEEFLAKYNEIWGESITDAVKEQKFEDLFVNWQGVRIGRGQVWFAGVQEKLQGEDGGYEDGGDEDGEYKVKIIAINDF